MDVNVCEIEGKCRGDQRGQPSQKASPCQAQTSGHPTFFRDDSKSYEMQERSPTESQCASHGNHSDDSGEREQDFNSL
jgi:hypothetical protein